MWGIEFYQLLAFGRQAGLAVTAAAAFWGMIFLYIAHKKDINDSAGIFLTWMGLRMRWLIVAGGLVSVLTWFGLTLLVPAAAHEGVTLITMKESVLSAMLWTTPLHILILGVVLYLVLYYKKATAVYSEKTGFSLVYLVAFVTASIAISIYTDLRGLPINETIFHIFHGFHSVFTLGTVLCLDLIFLSTQNAPFVQKHVVPLFPQISKVIWVGLSLDLFSTLLIYPEAIAFTPRFFFAQGVVGVLIINGVLLSGIITRRMLKNIEEGHAEKTLFWEKFATVAGAISVTSWMAITFVDQLHGLTISIHELIFIYIMVIAAIIAGHEVWNKIDTRAESLHEK